MYLCLFYKLNPAKIGYITVGTDSECTTDPGPPAAVTTAPLYENTQLPPPPPSVTDGGDSMYEHVELRPITGQEKEVAVAPNVAYGTVHR